MTKKADKSIDGPIKDFDIDSYDEVVQPVRSEERTEILLTGFEPKDLLIYFANRFKQCHGYEYIISWVKEVAIFKSFTERYGQDAGPMVQLLFDKYDGIINGGVMTVTAFSKGSKWIQDKLYIELQQSRVKEEPVIPAEGLMDSNDFLRKLSLG